jgi:hypothetical protein
MLPKQFPGYLTHFLFGVHDGIGKSIDTICGNTFVDQHFAVVNLLAHI